MRVIIFEHDDPDGPEEVDLEPRQVPPPVHMGKPHFRHAEGYWMIPPALVPEGAELRSFETAEGMRLEIGATSHTAILGPGCDRRELKMRRRELRGRKLDAAGKLIR